MAEVKTIALINKRNRSYNGVQPGQVIEVADFDKDAYLNFGFEVLGDSLTPDIPGEDENKKPELTKAQIEELLKEKGIAIPKKANKDELIALLNGEKSNSEGAEAGNEDSVDYAKLLTEAAIEFNEGDDLETLAKENNLV